MKIIILMIGRWLVPAIVLLLAASWLYGCAPIDAVVDVARCAGHGAGCN